MIKSHAFLIDPIESEKKNILGIDYYILDNKSYLNGWSCLFMVIGITIGTLSLNLAVLYLKKNRGSILFYFKNFPLTISYYNQSRTKTSINKKCKKGKKLKFWLKKIKDVFSD